MSDYERERNAAAKEQGIKAFYGDYDNYDEGFKAGANWATERAKGETESHRVRKLMTDLTAAHEAIRGLAGALDHAIQYCEPQMVELICEIIKPHADIIAKANGEVE